MGLCQVRRLKSSTLRANTSIQIASRVQMFSYWKTSKSQNFKTGVAGGGWTSLRLLWTVYLLHHLLTNELTFFESYIEVYRGLYIVVTSLRLWKKGNERFTCSMSVNVASLRARYSAFCIFSEGEEGAVPVSQRLANPPSPDVKLRVQSVQCESKTKSWPAQTKQDAYSQQCWCHQRVWLTDCIS